LSPRDHRNLHARAQQLHDAGAVAYVKAFHFFAARREIQPAVSEHAVHIQDQQANVIGAFDESIHGKKRVAVSG
jgi:hypothetical protein